MKNKTRQWYPDHGYFHLYVDENGWHLYDDMTGVITTHKETVPAIEDMLHNLKVMRKRAYKRGRKNEHARYTIELTESLIPYLRGALSVIRDFSIRNFNK